MKVDDLKYKIKVTKAGSGSYRVVIEYHNKLYYCVSNNSLAYDRIHNAENIPDKSVKYLYTYKGALESFWNECKMTNNLR